MEQWDVVNTMQQDLDKWMSNTSQALSSEVVDTQVAQSQQVYVILKKLGIYFSTIGRYLH